MTTIHAILIAVPFLTTGLSVWFAIRARSWRYRLAGLILGFAAGVVGIGSLFSYHEVCCVNYTSGGAYKRDKQDRLDKINFATVLLLQVALSSGIIAVGVRSRPEEEEHEEV